MDVMFPLVSFDIIPNEIADDLLTQWGHWLGGCNRPFGRQSFGLSVEGLGLISVAVSASTVNKRCAGFDRKSVVELARCASDPNHRWATRVCVRLWREVAPKCWSSKYWPVEAVVSYSNSLRHTGNLYRFDGWKRYGDVRGGVAGGNWSKGQKIDPKTVWYHRTNQTINVGVC